jgi:sodium-dependent phosphate cotransporter
LRTIARVKQQAAARWGTWAQTAARLSLVVLMLYLFLVAIKLLGAAARIAGSDTAEGLFAGLENPFAGLSVGILATVLVQSSSVTSSTIVAMVGAGQLDVRYAVPMVMGANIGTSITNTMVALGHVTRTAEFRRAFAGATVHDVFNVLTVAILFPFELATGSLRRSAQWLVGALPLHGVGGEFHSPINRVVKWLAGLVEGRLHHGLGIQGGWLAAVLAIVALAIIVFALLVITKNMKLLIADQVEEWLNRVLGQRGFLGLGIGIVVTVLVQSSSITTSLLVPMFGAGVLTLEAGFPITLGANIGTTITAIIAATVSGPTGLTIALVHLLFNVAGTALFLPTPFMRRIPIKLARKLAEAATGNRGWVVAYVVGVFVLIPLLGILIWK